MPKSHIRIRMSGEGVSPETVKASDLAAFLIEAEKAIVETARARGADLSTDEALVSLVAVGPGSDELTLAVSDRVLEGPKQVSQAIARNNYTDLPIPAWEALANISKQAKKRKWKVEILAESAIALEHAAITPDNGVPDPPPPPTVSGTTTVYGRLLRVGGSEPKAEVRIREGLHLLRLSVNEPMAKQLGRRLYEEVGIEGEAVWNTETWTIDTFRATRVIEYEPSTIAEAFKELAKASGGRWDGVDADEYIQQLRSNDE